MTTARQYGNADLFGIASVGDLFDETSNHSEEVITRRAESMLRETQLQSIGVCEAAPADESDNPDSVYTILFGRGRLRAGRKIEQWQEKPESCKAELRDLLGSWPGISYEVVDRPKSAIAAIIAENVERTEKTGSDRAKLSQRLYDLIKASGANETASIAATAYRLRVTDQAVKQHLAANRIANLIPELRLAVDEQAVSVQDASEFGKKFALAETADERTTILAEARAKALAAQQAGKGKGGKREERTPGKKTRGKVLAIFEAHCAVTPEDDYGDGIRDCLRWLDGAPNKKIEKLVAEASVEAAK